jgi:hypothetical protein
MKKGLILFLCLLAVSGFAADRTPYKFGFGANSNDVSGGGATSYTITDLVECYDMGLNFGSWPGLEDSLRDTAAYLGMDFWSGSYASSQEVNVYSTDSLDSHATRMADTTTCWLYIYASHYLDSIGVSVESLVVHIADDMLASTMLNETVGYKYRKILTAALADSLKRYSYQYWRNSSTGPYFPTGVTWLANGYCESTRHAIGYAFRRYLIEDSGNHMQTAYFMDNQYRGGYAARLYSYNTIDSTRGGPTAGLDWVEQPGIGTSIDTCQKYYDNSTSLIDSTINFVLDSTTTADGLHKIRGFANVDKFDYFQTGHQLRNTNIMFENPVDYGKSWSQYYNWYMMADTIAAHPERYAQWNFAGDFICSANPADWYYDSTRIYGFHYALFLQWRDTNIFVSPHRFNDHAERWQTIYEVNFGTKDSAAYEVSSVGSGFYDTRKVMRVDYTHSGSDNCMIVRTSDPDYDFTTDTVHVDLGGTFYKVSVAADTSATARTVDTLLMYEGGFYVSSAPYRGHTSHDMPRVPFSPQGRFTIRSNSIMPKSAIKIIVILLALSSGICAADYSFGGDSTGSTGVQRSDSSIEADTVTTPNNTGNLDSAVGWFSNNVALCSLAFVCYAEDSSIIDSTAYFAVASGSKTRYRADFIENASISAETEYFMAIHARSAGANSTYKIYVDAGGATPAWRYKNGEAVIPANFTGTITTGGFSRPVRFYYSDGGEAAELSGRRRRLILDQ